MRPERKGGSWIDIWFECPSARAELEAIFASRSQADGGTRERIFDFPMLEDWRWPSLEAWLAYFEGLGELPVPLQGWAFWPGLSNPLGGGDRAAITRARSVDDYREARSIQEGVIPHGEWYDHVNAVACLIGNTHSVEFFIELKLAQYREGSAVSYIVDVWEDHPICQAETGAVYPVHEENFIPPHYPGCRCDFRVHTMRRPD